MENDDRRTRGRLLLTKLPMDLDETKAALAELKDLAMDCMAVSVTITDARGILLYYDRHSTTILDRKPEYLGSDTRSHHQQAASNERVDFMLQAFAEGRMESFHFQAAPYGKSHLVTFAPIIRKDEFVGCFQKVRLRDEEQGS